MAGRQVYIEERRPNSGSAVRGGSNVLPFHLSLTLSKVLASQVVWINSLEGVHCLLQLLVLEGMFNSISDWGDSLMAVHAREPVVKKLVFITKCACMIGGTSA